MRLSLLLFLFTGFSVTHVFGSKQAPSVNYIKISQDFLYAARTQDTTAGYIDTLKNADEAVLAMELNTDDKRLAFWLNLYNGFTQVILRKDPGRYKSRNSFFSSQQINVAGNWLSLDDIEHGILRHSKIKWSEGYLVKLFPSGFEKKFRVEKLDYRIHFALNCGAKSCPPIAFYEPEDIDRQLTMAVKSYLQGECSYDSVGNVVHVPAFMGWFRRDFGGKKNMLKILKNNAIIPQDSNPAIHFKKYNWELYLNNYKT
ncbi:DUF547 domain-containing protein [Mucilaginibacter sp. UYCu711]|uniref:DUF547 domain-containing protein n=1 Tax=Mucilaginibacter sp. UYCu711 TaxID=3156339 RepID=UPI003D23F919